MTTEQPESLTSGAIAPYTDGVLASGVKDILADLIEEAKRRLDNPKELKKLSFSEILTHIEQIIKATKQPGAVMLVKNAQVSLSDIQKRVQAIDASPTRRKELRESARHQLKSRPN